MANTLRTTTANAALDYIYNTLFGNASLLYIRTGAGAGPDNAAGGTALATITTPSPPFAAAAAKSIAKTGSWTDTADAAGTAGHYRLTDAADTDREEGTITATGGGGDMTIDNTSIAIGQTVTVTGYTRSLP